MAKALPHHYFKWAKCTYTLQNDGPFTALAQTPAHAGQVPTSNWSQNPPTAPSSEKKLNTCKFKQFSLHSGN